MYRHEESSDKETRKSNISDSCEKRRTITKRQRDLERSIIYDILTKKRKYTERDKENIQNRK